jgi:putative transposase
MPTPVSYPTDLTDAQWALLQPYLPQPKTTGRPPTDRRVILNAILYLSQAGCAWRLLPKDFGPWPTVYGVLRHWQKVGLWSELNDRLRARVRAAVGKDCRPSAAILDSQTVRSSDHGGVRGFDAAKKTLGRKRPVLVDTLGLLLGVKVTAANVSERAGARLLLAPLLAWLWWLRRIFADGGYSGPNLACWVRERKPSAEVAVVPRIFPSSFHVLPKRWIVERTFGWLHRRRRLVRDYETKTEHAEAFVYIAMLPIMLRRLA